MFQGITSLLCLPGAKCFLEHTLGPRLTPEVLKKLILITFANVLVGFMDRF